jgi:23S rRNA pseudouridine2605 synthase
MRLQRALAQAGVASRRASERLIRAGRVEVNGKVVTEMGLRVDPQSDVIAVDGRRVHIPGAKRYIKLYKPRGYLSVVVDDRGRPDLADLVPDVQGLYPAGRLDLDSEGLVLLTDDGTLTYRLTHPSFEHDKEYWVLVRGTPDGDTLGILRAGVLLEDGKTAPARVEQVVSAPWGKPPRDHSWLRFVIHEGRKRQLRRMCAAVGHPVRRLIRTRIESLELGGLTAGEWRPLTGAERDRLRASVGLREAA